MTGFVAIAPTPGATRILRSGDWYPAIDVAEARKIIRIDGTVTDERLIECLGIAMCAVEDRLDAWQQCQVTLDRATLEDVPAKAINDQSRLVLLYLRAIYATAQAELVERYRDYSATNAGNARADVVIESADDYRRMATYAIRDIQSRPRSDVELI